MKLISHLSSIALLAAVKFALAQNETFLAGLLSTLNETGASSLSGLASQLNSSDQGRSLLTALSNGDPYALFAPNDTAFSNAPSSAFTNIDNFIAYHLVTGNFSGVNTSYANTTLGRTFLNDSQLVQLEGNQSQVLAWAFRTDHVTVLNQPMDTIVTNTTSFGNITINVIDHILTFPGTFEQTVASNNDAFGGISSALGNVSAPFFNASTGQTTNTSVFSVVNNGLHGFTLFAPNSTAVAAIASDLASLESNTTLLEIVLKNHLINGTSAYSPELVGTNFTSASGEVFSSSINSTGQYVTSGGQTALIVQPDVLLSNGVVHVIDRVLLNTNEDAGAASSAAASATSAATQSTTETRPIGFAQTASLAAASGATTETASSSTGSTSTGSASTGSTSTGSTSTGSTSTSSTSTTTGSTNTGSTTAGSTTSGSTTTGSTTTSASAGARAFSPYLAQIVSISTTLVGVMMGGIFTVA
ncbi:uncharacterized protein FIBRA_01991 [Fibroporia radiculosa]|uniref:FAS1 domain-containing protein n=1 Tax=Fibroporia radiculosa TaxID=599839 RepID=J4I8T4_9APHY|nr:uncharacterized protein FIBRA_01991 [Fibroporia radiculosa]CCL99966.1 predicted protein [Fibroporia radiculosa]